MWLHDKDCPEYGNKMGFKEGLNLSNA